MQIATTLGWRDPVTQVWAMQASKRTGEPEKTMQRAEALFQQEQFLAPSLALLLQDAPDGPTARALTQALAERPIWRANFVKAAAQLPPAYVEKLTEVASALNRGSAALSVDEAQPLLDRLLAADDPGQARMLWAAVRRGGLIANGNFEAVSSRNGAEVPSDWDIGDEDVATIATQAPEFPGNGRALRISSGARAGRSRLPAPDAGSWSLFADLPRAQRRGRIGAPPLAASLLGFGCKSDLAGTAGDQLEMAGIQRQAHCAKSGLRDPKARS